MADPRDTALASLICERNDHHDAPACDGCYAMAAWLREHGYERAPVPAPATPDLRAFIDAVDAWLAYFTKQSVGLLMDDDERALVRRIRERRAALSDRDAEPVSRDPLPCGWRYPSNGGHCWAPEAWHDGEKGKHAYVPEERRSGADRRKASRDALRLDPEVPESVERLARALLPGHDFMHEGDQDTCSERDMPAAMEAAERIARAFAAPDPTEDTPNG